jgi:NAD(P)-dependent dehydrogenase (short-subunit alcohol dehydrogenase family)
VLVTGATSGIGAATVAALGTRPGIEVLVHGRDPARGARLVADLTVRADVERLAAEAGPVDVLVNNAGAVFGEHVRTPDGHERTWALNHLAPFLLTAALRPARVITVSSAAHRRARSTGTTRTR